MFWRALIVSAKLCAVCSCSASALNVNLLPSLSVHSTLTIPCPTMNSPVNATFSVPPTPFLELYCTLGTFTSSLAFDSFLNAPCLTHAAAIAIALTSPLVSSRGFNHTANCFGACAIQPGPYTITPLFFPAPLKLINTSLPVNSLSMALRRDVAALLSGSFTIASSSAFVISSDTGNQPHPSMRLIV